MKSKKNPDKAVQYIKRLARRSIIQLIPYASARSEFAGKAKIFLDANENTIGSAVKWPQSKSNLNRYPDPLQLKLRAKMARIYSRSVDAQIDVNQIFVGNGSDEAIDLLMRVFCDPQKDSILITPPTYAMYEVIANVQSVKIKRVDLDKEYRLVPKNIFQALKKNPKIFFICSPNNPTANTFSIAHIKSFAKVTKGLLVVDEAYIDFSDQKSAISLIKQHPNIVVLRTLSKAWGLAGIRVGFAVAHPEIISLLQKIKSPYNLSSLAQAAAIEATSNMKFLNRCVSEIKRERMRLSKKLALSHEVLKVYHSEASFLLVKFKNPAASFAKLLKHGIVVRDRSKAKGCEGCFRIAVGTYRENNSLLSALGVRLK